MFGVGRIAFSTVISMNYYSIHFGVKTPVLFGTQGEPAFFIPENMKFVK